MINRIGWIKDESKYNMSNAKMSEMDFMPGLSLRTALECLEELDLGIHMHKQIKKF